MASVVLLQLMVPQKLCQKYRFGYVQQQYTKRLFQDTADKTVHVCVNHKRQVLCIHMYVRRYAHTYVHMYK